MNSLRADILVTLVAAVLCLEIAVVFGLIYLRDGRREEHRAFSLFNFSLSAMIVCRLLIVADVSSRYLALRAFQWHCVAGCFAMGTFVQFTWIITDCRIRMYMRPVVLYAITGLAAALYFTHWALHLAPAGTNAHNYTDQEAGPLFAVITVLVLACGTLPIYLLMSASRKPRAAIGVGNTISNGTDVLRFAEVDALDLVLLRRHLTPVFWGTLLLVAFIVVDLVWFLNPVSDAPIPFSAIGMIFLSAMTAGVLAQDIVRSEKRKVELAAVAKASLDSLSDAEHQLKNQIASIIKPLMTAMLELNPGGDAALVKTKVASTIDQARELEETLDNMLNVRRAAAGKRLELSDMVAVDLPALLQSVCNRRQSQDTSSGERRFRVESLLPISQVFIHKTELKHVFFNLIDNAFKYSPANSPIRVEITVDEADEKVRVRICDQGKGVSAEDHERIFSEEFYRGDVGDQKTSGMGHGLKLARHYVAAMQGRLWVESGGVDQGSTFVVELPYLPD